ncbi:hypothetical protein [Oceanobacillus kapialis]|uniref:ABC-2 type transporter domain-containing protein n=1 Tax=Oceanobacillus kapialis TaxID=481353 RepID=A0ABW5Q234_9BACI
MSEWLQAYRIAKLELQKSVLGFLQGLFLTTFVTIFLITSLSSYLDNGYVGFDFFFLLLFSVGLIWAKPKEFQLQKVNGDLLASPIFMMQLALPIKRSILIKSRFIIQFVYSFPFQLLFLIAFYIFSPINDTFSISGYLAFMVFWLLIGMFFGCALPSADAGDSSKLTTTTIGSIFSSILLLIISIAVLIAVHASTGEGPVYWSIKTIERWPLLAIGIAILLTLTTMAYWLSYMQKRLAKQDYL